MAKGIKKKKERKKAIQVKLLLTVMQPSWVSQARSDLPHHVSPQASQPLPSYQCSKENNFPECSHYLTKVGGNVNMHYSLI
jgi:hypothetical protein